MPIVTIVEDDAPLRAAIGFSLATEGYPVRAFDSGEALLAANDLESVSCFVIDQKLPGMEGMPLIEELQRRGLKARAVMITTRPSPALRETCWALGVPIVEKPILGESLNACIRGLLARPVAG